MRSISDTTILITGATSGFGRGLAHQMAARGARVLLHGRNETKLAETKAEIHRATGSKRLETFCADLAEQAQVHGLAESVANRTDELHVLVNNAGVGPGPDRAESQDGHELSFAVNYLAAFALTLDLLPHLRGSYPARIVNVASAGQAPLDFGNLMLTRDYEPWQAYRQSKLALIMFTFELADRLPPGIVTVNAVHPATFAPTNMVLRAAELGVKPQESVETGVTSIMRLVSAPDLDEVSGHYWNRLEQARAHEQAYDADARARLWTESLRLTGCVDPALQLQAN